MQRSEQIGNEKAIKGFLNRCDEFTKTHQQRYPPGFLLKQYNNQLSDQRRTEGSIQGNDYDETMINSVQSTSRAENLGQFKLPSGVELEQQKSKTLYKLPLINMGLSRVEINKTMETI